MTVTRLGQQGHRHEPRHPVGGQQPGQADSGHSDDVADVVVLWWRDDDGDLVDGLINAIAPLADDGFVWVFTPKTGQDGYVDAADISEAASTAGLTQTSVVNFGTWSGSRLVQPKSRTGKRA